MESFLFPIGTVAAPLTKVPNFKILPFSNFFYYELKLFQYSNSRFFSVLILFSWTTEEEMLWP